MSEMEGPFCENRIRQKVICFPVVLLRETMKRCSRTRSNQSVPYQVLIGFRHLIAKIEVCVEG